MPLPSWLKSQIFGQKPRTREATALIKMYYNLLSIYHMPGHVPSTLFYLHNDRMKQVRLCPSYR